MASLLKPCSAWDAFQDLKYGPGTNQVFDLYVPRNNGTNTNPLITVIHGGGWEGGTENFDFFTSILVSGLIRRGFAIASVRYRLSGERPHPAQISDVLSAIRELRYQAPSRRVYPNKIGLWGMSAGGHLAALAGVASTEMAFQSGTRPGVSSTPAVVVADYPPTSFINWVNTPGFESLRSPSSIVGRLFGGKDVRTIPEIANAASPACRVTANATPLWLRHGTADTVVPISQSRELRNAYVAAGVPVTLTERADFTHTDSRFYSNGEISAVGDYFDYMIRP